MRVGESRLKSVQSKALTHNFGYFQKQIKGLPLKEAEKRKNAPIDHVCGNHEECGEWCLARKAKQQNKVYNHQPMFDMSNPEDKKTAKQVRKVHENFTTPKRLEEMNHPCTTQANESLNMRAAEVAPKYKNYSRTKSLNLRVDFVVGRHNAGHHYFFSNALGKLGLAVDSGLDKWIENIDERKCAKKIHDTSREYKKFRKHKWKVKEKCEVLLERTRDVKVGTYKSGAAMEAANSNTKKKRKRKPRTPCDCGGPKTHFNTNSQFCRKMEKPKNTSNDATTDITLTIANIP